MYVISLTSSVAGNIGESGRPQRDPAPRLAKEIYNLSFTTPYIFTGKLLNIKLHEEILSFFNEKLLKTLNKTIH